MDIQKIKEMDINLDKDFPFYDEAKKEIEITNKRYLKKLKSLDWERIDIKIFILNRTLERVISETY